MARAIGRKTLGVRRRTNYDVFMKLKHILLLTSLLCAAGSVGAASPALDELRAAAGASASIVAISAPRAQPGAERGAAAPVLPDELAIHERLFALTDTFDLKAGGVKLGTITEKFFSLTKSFVYADAQKNCVAMARARLLSWGTAIDVTDCAGRPIGAIQENVFASFFKTWTTYAILDAQGRERATSEKTEWISTNLTIRRPDGRTIAELRRSWLNMLSDSWTMTIRDRAAVDARLIVFIAAYKTSVDNERRNDKKKEEEKKEEKKDDE